MTFDGLPQATVVHLRIPSDWKGVLDILFDGHRIMSVDPVRHRAAAGAREIAWPGALLPYLHGETELTLQAHADGTVRFRGDVRFNDVQGRVSVKDATGFPLALDKWDNLVRTFESKDPSYAEALLEDLENLLLTLNGEIQVPSFVAYGSLLGGVREGGFISHDTDADIAYLSRHSAPADIARESFTIERQLRKHGWRTHRITAGFIQVWDARRNQDQHIDIFTSYFMAEWWAMDRWVRSRLSQDALVPLSEVEFEGRMLPAPADPEAVLAAIYGPGWRVPDPSFKFTHPRATIARARGFLGQHRWIHGGRPAVLEPDSAHEGESSFAHWVGDLVDQYDSVLEVGCRTGNDSLWLASRCADVTGFDHMDGAIESATAKATHTATVSNLSIHRWSVYDLRRMITAAAQLRSRADRPALYVRRIVEVLRPEGKENIWLMARTGLRGGGRLFLEVGPELDVAEVKVSITARGGSVERCDRVDEPAGPAHRLVATW